MNNQFHPFFRDNPRFSLDDLKTEYRARVKQVHPDAGASDSELFIRLKADFEEACLLIDQTAREEDGSAGSKNTFSKVQLKEQFFLRFNDFLRRGFLTSKEKIRASYDYKKSLDAVRLTWTLWHGPDDERFDDFLTDYNTAHARSPTSGVWERMNAFLYTALDFFTLPLTGISKQKRLLSARNYEDAIKLISRIYNSFPALMAFLKFVRDELD